MTTILLGLSAAAVPFAILILALARAAGQADAVRESFPNNNERQP